MFIHTYNPTNIFVLTSEYCKAARIVCTANQFIKLCEENMLVDVFANSYNNGISTTMQTLKKVLAEDNTGVFKVW